MSINLKAFTKLITISMLAAGFLVSSSFTGSTGSKRKLKGTVNITGTRFFFPLIEKWAAEFEKENPGVDVVVKFGIANKDIEATGTPVEQEDPTKGRYTTVSRFALVPIINEKNPAWSKLQQKGISKDELQKIYFKGDNQQSNFISNSGLTVPIRVYTRGACASATFSKHFGKQIKDLSNLDTKIADDEVLLQNVLNDSLGVAYSNLGFVYDLKTRKQKKGLHVVPIDINGNGKVDTDEAFYGSLDQLIKQLEVMQSDLPPTGNMVFIYKEDKPEVKAFVDWIITKGQQYNHATGFLYSQPQSTAQRR